MPGPNSFRWVSRAFSSLSRQLNPYLALSRNTPDTSLPFQALPSRAQHPTSSALFYLTTASLPPLLYFSSPSHAEHTHFEVSPAPLFRHPATLNTPCPSPRLSSALTAADRAAARLPGPSSPHAPPQPSRGIDHTLLELRCLADEASCAARDARAAQALARANRSLEAFQLRQRGRVNAYVDALLPSGGLRGQLFAAARARREEANAAAVRGLVEEGRAPREVYGLLWEQQWRRRESVAKMAGAVGASGVMRFFVNYVAGVPEAVLELARGLNEEGGPTEALRGMFGEELTGLLDAGWRMRALAVRMEEGGAAGGETMRRCRVALGDAAEAYACDVEVFVERLEKVITESKLFDAPDVENLIANSPLGMHALADSPAVK